MNKRSVVSAINFEGLGERWEKFVAWSPAKLRIAVVNFGSTSDDYAAWQSKRKGARPLRNTWTTFNINPLHPSACRSHDGYYGSVPIAHA